jgi:excisionase family DNA binding protein
MSCDPISPPEVLTPVEAQELLRVSRNTMYDLLRRGQVPGARRLGRSYRIHRATLISWLGQGGDLSDRR